MDRYHRSYQPHSVLHASQAGFIRGMGVIALLVLIIMGVFNTYRSVAAHAYVAMPEIRSMITGLCVDDHHDDSAAGSAVIGWPCNDSPAQDWSYSGTSLRHDGGGCLSVAGAGTVSGTPVVMDPCGSTPGQQWDVYLSGYQNPNSGMCLTLPGGKSGVQLTIAACDNISGLNQGWSAVKWSDSQSNGADCAHGTEGQKVACIAQQQWGDWQAGKPSHQVLLNSYSDGNSYEEWCADFVSYVYKAAGYPFANGERSGWDEYNANLIQYLGFSKHTASGYVPKAGDVAYFNYGGGHVEIVVVGGAHPTFIYGNSGTTDPATQNGEMNEDMLTNDGSAGGVVYYLSPILD